MPKDGFFKNRTAAVARKVSLRPVGKNVVAIDVRAINPRIIPP